MVEGGTVRVVLAVVFASSLFGAGVAGASIGATGTALSTDGAIAETPQQTEVRGDVSLGDYSPPSTLERGQVYSTSVSIENAGDEMYRIELEYHFEGDPVTIERLAIEPGESIRESVSFGVADIESAVGSVESGQLYTHGVAVTIVTRDGDRVESDRLSEDVRIAPSEDGAGSALDVELEADLPDILERDRPTQARVRITNNADREATLEMGYFFEETVLASEQIDVGPNTEITQEVPIDVTDIENELGTTLDPSREYYHEFAVREFGGDGDILDHSGGPVRIAPPDGGADSTDSTEATQAPTADESGGGDHRGFLTNDPDSSIAFLDDPMFLTVVGFFLSVLGILYQMAGGG